MVMGSLKIATHNLRGLSDPWRYTMERGIVRGTAPGSPATTMRVSGGLWSRRRGLLADALRRVGPGIIGLQEVREGRVMGGSSQAEQLASDLGCHYAFVPLRTVSHEEGAVAQGPGVVSRHPILTWRNVPLPPPAMPDHQQQALHAIVDTSLGEIDLIVVHLTPRSEEAQIAVAECLLQFLNGRESRRIPVDVGDFNAERDSRTITLMQDATARRGHSWRLRDAWHEARPGDPGPTMPSQSLELTTSSSSPELR